MAEAIPSNRTPRAGFLGAFTDRPELRGTTTEEGDPWQYAPDFPWWKDYPKEAEPAPPPPPPKPRKSIVKFTQSYIKKEFGGQDPHQYNVKGQALLIYNREVTKAVNQYLKDINRVQGDPLTGSQKANINAIKRQVMQTAQGVVDEKQATDVAALTNAQNQFKYDEKQERLQAQRERDEANKRLEADIAEERKKAAAALAYDLAQGAREQKERWIRERAEETRKLPKKKSRVQQAISAANYRTALIEDERDESTFQANASLYNITNRRNEVAYWQTEGREKTKVIKIPVGKLRDGWTPEKIQEAALAKVRTIEQVLGDLGIIKLPIHLMQPAYKRLPIPRR